MDKEKINLDIITVEDAEFLYWQGKRLLINDGRVVGIEKDEEEQCG